MCGVATTFFHASLALPQAPAKICRNMDSQTTPLSSLQVSLFLVHQGHAVLVSAFHVPAYAIESCVSLPRCTSGRAARRAHHPARRKPATLEVAYRTLQGCHPSLARE
jgi:hypothetical protein